MFDGNPAFLSGHTISRDKSSTEEGEDEALQTMRISENEKKSAAKNNAVEEKK